MLAFQPIAGLSRDVDRRLALFAADRVGLESARVVAESGARLAALVLDRADARGLNASIRQALDGHVDTVVEWGAAPTSDAIESVIGARPTIGVLAWWPYVLPRRLLEIPELGFLNFHPSLLPHQRGKHYYFWAIVERSPFGVTIHWATPEVDAGPIAFQRRLEVTWSDTGATLRAKAQTAMVGLFRENLDVIVRGEIPRVPQSREGGPAHRAAEMDQAAAIDLDRTYTGRELLDLIRARTFPPDGGAEFEDEGRRFRVTTSIEPIP